jgi:uncharacterized protein YigA (DUF484 family)
VISTPRVAAARRTQPSAERSRSGVASGALTAFRQAGSLLGVALFGALAAGRFYPGMRTALWISIGVLTVSALVSWPRRGSGRRQPMPSAIRSSTRSEPT